MSKTLSFKAAKGVRLASMSEPEIRQLVQQQADLALKALPKELRPSAVNSIIVESNPAELRPPGGGGSQTWAEWCRACCDRRSRIDDFVNPQLDQLTRGLDREAERTNLHQDHFDSYFAIRQVPARSKGSRKAPQ